ncbi:flippase-like domain-containing protein [Candidatus Woesearchaeota archaeon]|nr:flippase-like domain-containing protein [Candidatus Woesearchaeota archaeon]
MKKKLKTKKNYELINKLSQFNKTKRPLSIVIFALLGVVGLTIILLKSDFNEILGFLRNTTMILIIFYLLIQVLLMLVLTMRWAVILESQGHRRINLFRLNKYRVVGQAVSFLTPTAKMGGEGIKTRIMSKRESIPYSKALSSTFIDNSVDLTASGLFFLIGTIIILLSINVGFKTKMFLGCLIFLFLFFLGVFNYRLFKGKPMMHGLAKRFGLFKIKMIKDFEHEIKKFDEYLHEFYRKDKKHFYYAILLSLISWILMFFEYYVAGRMLGFNFSAWMIFLIVTLVGLAYLIPTPMALGTLEAGQISAFSILNISSAAGIGLSFIVRAKDMLIAFWGVGIMSFYGFNPNNALEKAGFGDEVENKK